LGQSVVEAFDGKHNSQDLAETNDYFGHIKHMFQKRFNSPSKDNHFIKGVSMGLSGDQANNILWRLIHGELNQNFDPPFWWIVVGMEDLARFKCSEEIVIMGILRIVEEIKKFKPHAKIIINGLFPMTSLRSAEPEPLDFIDAEREEKQHESNNNNRRHLADVPVENGSGMAYNKNAKTYKAKMALRVKKRYDVVKQNHEIQEKEIQDKITQTRENKDLSKKDKQAKLDELREQLKAMKQQHRKMQKAILEYLKKTREDKFNPEMKENHTFHKDNLFHHHKDRQIPVFTAIHAINNELHSFCRRTEHVTFYDPTSLFTESNGDRTTLLTDYISPRGHPTEEGYKLWLNDIQIKLIEWKVKNEEALAKLNSNINGDSNSEVDDEWSALLNEYYYENDDEAEEGDDDGADKNESIDTNQVESESENDAYDDNNNDFEGDDDWEGDDKVADDDGESNYYVDDELDDFDGGGEGDDENNNFDQEYDW
jgi:hypothetical protein